MARPTIAEQIAKAAAEGDLDKVRVLAEKMKPKTKNKVVKNKKPKSSIVYEHVKAEEPDDNFIVSAKSDKGAKREYVDEEGNVRIRMKTVPFIITKHKNTWEDNSEDLLSDAEFDKKTHINNKKITKRDPIEKINIQCCRCKRFKSMWPGEVLNKNYSCDECLIANK